MEPQSGRHHRNGLIGSRDGVVLCRCFPVFHGRAFGRRHLPHDCPLQFHVVAARFAPFRPRCAPRSHLGDDARGDFHRVAHGAHLLVRLHARRARLPALLCLLEPLHHVDARTGARHQHLPDVHVLGIGRRIVLSPHRFLLHGTRRHRCLQEGLHRDALCRYVLLGRHFGVRLFCAFVQLLLCGRRSNGRTCRTFHSSGGESHGGRRCLPHSRCVGTDVYRWCR